MQGQRKCKTDLPLKNFGPYDDVMAPRRSKHVALGDLEEKVNALLRDAWGRWPDGYGWPVADRPSKSIKQADGTPATVRYLATRVVLSPEKYVPPPEFPGD